MLELGSEEDLSKTVQECIKELTRLDNLAKSIPAARSAPAGSSSSAPRKDEHAGAVALSHGLQQAGWMVCDRIHCVFFLKRLQMTATLLSILLQIFLTACPWRLLFYKYCFRSFLRHMPMTVTLSSILLQRLACDKYLHASFYRAFPLVFGMNIGA